MEGFKASRWSGYEFDCDASGLALAETQAISSNRDFDRISQGRDAEQLELDARCQAHFEQSNCHVVHPVNLENTSPLSHRGIRKQSHVNLPLPANEFRSHDDIEDICIAKTKFLVSNSHDTGGARLQHLNCDARTEPKFFEAVDLIGLANELLDLGTLPAGQQI